MVAGTRNNRRIIPDMHSDPQEPMMQSSSSCTEDQRSHSPQSDEGSCGDSVSVGVTETMANDQIESSELSRRNPRRKCTKQVRFAPEIVQVLEFLPTRAELSDAETRTFWWLSEDYDEFKLTAKLICKEVRRNTKYTAGLDAAYRRATRAAFTIEDEEKADDVEGVLEDLNLDLGLAQWCTHGHSRRGLERWGSRMHGLSRGEHAEDAKTEIVKLAYVIDDMEQLRIEAEKRTRVSRIFARMMGEADSVAAKKKPSSRSLRNSRWADNRSPRTTPDRSTKSLSDASRDSISSGVSMNSMSSLHERRNLTDSLFPKGGSNSNRGNRLEKIVTPHSSLSYQGLVRTNIVL
mmetsp:Transcript_3411/g.5017  ORF Transcript_3411/g.5017 Transcript_3411/m.5017 type:complete len:348 (+) Transcript_3411:64-1107(+)